MDDPKLKQRLKNTQEFFEIQHGGPLNQRRNKELRCWYCAYGVVHQACTTAVQPKR